MIKMLYEVLVHVPETYSSTKTFDSGFEISVENDTDDVVNTIRHGKVIEVPILIPSILKKGDEIYFHHNIIRKTVDWHGKIKNGMFEFDRTKGLYRCPLEEIFAIVRNGKFKAIAPYCFVKPIKQKEEEKIGEFFIRHIEEESEQLGVIVYGNEALEEMGIYEGNSVIFSKDSEYTYNIYGEKLYRMRNSDIMCRIVGGTSDFMCSDEGKAWIKGKDSLNKQS